ncbi:N-acetyltransferase [Nocardioides marmorisolisilvae]|uniref:N-acetyltransferase n=1 Tax=Nocardioides marmorisolisilvae TaxID=1542737 RepID=A0A3N0DXZ4_9ACTN|nr:N-acetyltransferase [Nocardioides marmorisolisilvae]
MRSATPSDLDVLREIYRRASLSNEGDRAALLGAPDALVWAGDGITDGGTLVVEDGAGQVVGFATTVRIDEGLELDDLFVDPASMRQGLATLLVDALVVRAAADGAPWIEVTANPHAADFYASAEFTPVGTTETRFGPAPRLRREVRASSPG